MNILLLVASVALADTGVASVAGTAADSKISGSVRLTDTPAGLKVEVSVTGLTPGAHGFHIHENGACGDSGKAAGAHYNPSGAPHGELSKSDPMKVHAGDSGNLTADKDGKAEMSVTLPGVTVSGKLPVAGRAVIVHEKADDFSQPAGNAGGRVACGIIGVVTTPAKP